MIDLLAGKRARMACRIYLKLYDAGLAGTKVVTADAIGPRDSDSADFPVAVELLRPLVDDTILDEVGHQGGEPHYALTPIMRERMDSRLGNPNPLVELARADLAAFDQGEDVPAGNFLFYEHMIRTGNTDGADL